MHPEVRQETPGRCPKCGMKLVLESGAKPITSHDDRGLGTLTWKSYVPLFVILGLIALATAVLAWRDNSLGLFSERETIGYFMAGFFLVFAGFKLLDLKGFAEGYTTYDLIAQRMPAYGYFYPFVELYFGLAMLAGFTSRGLLWAELIVMGVSGVGVFIKLLKREKVQCVCLGTILKVPLTNITLIEDFGMAALAAILLFF